VSFYNLIMHHVHAILLCVFIDTLYTDTLLVGTGIRSSAREDIDDARHN